MTSVAVNADAYTEGTTTLVGFSPSTSGWDGPPVTTNQIVPSGGYTSTSLSQLTRQNQSSMQAAVSAPVLASANRFQFNSGQIVNAAIDEFGAMICRALAGIDILGLHPFGFMSAWADNLDAAAQQALGTAQTAQATANTAVNAVNNQQQQQSSGGASISVSPFPPGYSGNLGPGWTTGGTAGSAQWMTGKYGAGLSAQPSKVAVAGTQFALNTTVMQTDSHTASGVIGYGDPNSIAGTALIVRAAADMSSFIYVNTAVSSAYLGAGSYNSSTGAWSFGVWASITSNFLLYGGDTLTLSVVGATATFSRNGTPVLSHSDISAQVPVGASNRSVGLFSQQAIDGWGNVSVGWDMASFTAVDTASPPTLGTGWSIYRGSASAVSLGNGSSNGWKNMASGTYDTVRAQSANIKWSTFDSGVVIIPRTGWWLISVGVDFDNAPTGASAGIAVTSGGTGTETLARSGHFVDCYDSGHEFTVTWHALTTNVIYLNQGDLVQPGILISGLTTFNLNITGGGNGSGTYFDGTFVNG